MAQPLDARPAGFGVSAAERTPRRIAMLGPFGFHPKKTMRARAFRLARALAQRGHSVAMWMPPWNTPDEAGRAWQEDGVAITYIHLSGGVVGITHRLIQAALAWQPDVVHCFKPKAYSGLAAWRLWHTHRRRLRLVMDSDDWEGWGGWNDREAYPRLAKHFFAWQERWGMRHCHALTVASRALETLAWGLGVPRQQVVYLPNGPGIEPPPFTPRPPRPHPTLLLYSRFFEFDIQRLVAVLVQAQRQLPDLRIQVVGESLEVADGARLHALLAQAGLLDRVENAGWVAETDAPSLISQADLGLYLMDDTLLNRTKCPVKLADMLSVGLPVVAEAVGQTPEYIRHGETGWLSPSGDVAGLVEGIITLLTDEARRQQLALGAWRHLEAHFTWEQLAVRAERLYSPLLSRQG